MRVFIFLGIHRVHPVDEGLHLAAHLIVIDGCRPADDIGIQDTVHDSRNIILEYTGAGFLAGQAADAELDFLPFQGDEFNLVSSAFRTFGELLMAVGARTETGGYDNYIFHAP